MEEDETNQQTENCEPSIQIRPAKVSSVLGKAQAKKRLMAFSISKQAAQIAAKKQAQTGAKERKDNDAEMKTNVTEDGRPLSEIAEAGPNVGIFDDKHSKKKSAKKSKNSDFRLKNSVECNFLFYYA